MEKEHQETLTTAQAAKVLQKSPHTIRALLRRGQLPGKRIGRDWRISRQALEELLRGQTR